MIRKLDNWFKNKIRKILSKILQEEYYISADIGFKNTEILVCKYSYKTGRIEIISDNCLNDTPLKDIKQKIRYLARKYNASVVMDYPSYFRRIKYRRF